MNRPFYFLIVLVLTFGGIHSAWADDGVDFDDTEFDDVVFEDETSSSNWFMENVTLELGHSLSTSRNSDWNLIGNKTTGKLGWSSSLATALYTELEGQLDLYWGDDLKASDEYDARFTNAFIQSSVGNFSSKLGYFTLGWGEVEGSQVLDVINPTASITSGSMDISGESQLLLSTDIYMGASTTRLFINLAPEVASLPIPLLTAKSTDELEYGGQLKLSMAGSDIAFYLAQLLPNTPVINTATNETQANPFSLVGVSMNRTLGKMLLKGDLAYKQGLEIIDSSVTTGPVSIDRVDYAVGVEYGFSDGKQLVVTLNNKQTLDFKQSYLALPDLFGAPAIKAEEHASQMMLSFSDSYLNETLSLDGGAMTSLNSEMTMLFSQLDYSLSDRWSVNGSLVIAFADPESMFASYDQEVMISAGATWSN